MMPREEGAMAQKVAFLLWDTLNFTFQALALISFGLLQATRL
jgi:hypothetical protein